MQSARQLTKASIEYLTRVQTNYQNRLKYTYLLARYNLSPAYVYWKNVKKSGINEFPILQQLLTRHRLNSLLIILFGYCMGGWSCYLLWIKIFQPG